jgi:predicted TIM-barrel fold metal-dependent hydrolase
VEKILYGSDYSMLDPAFSMGMVMSSEINDEYKEKIFYKNAQSLFGL